MRRAASPACALVLCGALAGCGTAAPRTVSPASASAECVLSGSPSAMDLRAGADAFLAVSLRRGDAQARVRVDGHPFATAEVLAEGWTLRGSVDLAEDGVVRARRPLALGSALLVPPEAAVRVVSVEPHGLRVDRGEYAVDDSVSLLAPTETTVACADLGLGWAFRDGRTEAREWAALDLPPRAPGDARFLPGGAALELLDAPGGAVVARIAAVEHVRELVAIETRDGHLRLALRSWSGPVLVGWAPETAVASASPDEGGVEGILGGMSPGAQHLHVCTTSHAVSIHARRITVRAADGTAHPVPPGPLVEIGTAPAGARLVVRSRDAESCVVEVAPGSGVAVGSEAEWRVAASELADAACADETYDPMAALRAVLRDD